MPNRERDQTVSERMSASDFAEQPAIDRKLTALFEAAARNLSAYEGNEVHDRIRCPLCLEYFDRDVLAARELSDAPSGPTSQRLARRRSRGCGQRAVIRWIAQRRGASLVPPMRDVIAKGSNGSERTRSRTARSSRAKSCRCRKRSL